jgi:hypothetical protein
MQGLAADAIALREVSYREAVNLGEVVRVVGVVRYGCNG